MTVTPYRWPTQHDLPDTDDTPLDNEDQGRQYPLLREPLLLPWSDRQDFFVACNIYGPLLRPTPAGRCSRFICF
jgi:hypothetical protein